MMKLNVFCASVLLLCATCSFAQTTEKEELSPDVVAIVNGEKITRKELADELIATFGRAALDNLIMRKLVEQEARKRGITVSDEEVEKALDEEVKRGIEQYIKAYNLGDMEGFARYVEERGGTVEEAKRQFREKLRAGVRATVLADKILRQMVTVSPEEVREEYEKRYGTQIIARQIVLPTRRDAEEVLEKLKAGADFALLAREYSIDVATRAKGGQMRPLTLNSELGKAVADVPEGELSSIIKTGYGYHIIQVLERRESKGVPFEKVAPELKEEIVKKRVEEMRASWLTDLLDKAVIRRSL